MSMTPPTLPALGQAFSALIESSNDAVCFLDPEGNILMLNTIFADRFGKSPRECINANVFDMISDLLHLPEVANHRRVHCEKVLRTGKQVRFEDTRGENITNISINPVRSAEGEITQLLVIIQDITKYKHLLQTSFKKESRLNLALELARAGVWEWDLVTGENIWSDELWRLYGLEMNRQAASFELWASTVHPDDRDTAFQSVSAAVNNENELNLEYRVVHPDGSVHWLMSRGAPLRNERNKVCRYIGMVVDVTERKRIADELNENRKIMDFALEKSLVGIWSMNLKDFTVKRTREHARIFGYDSGHSEWTLKKFLDHVVPDDRKNLEPLIRNSIENQKDYSFDCRITRLDGEVRWISVKGAFQADKEGKSNHVLGIVEDITERKRAEEEQEIMHEHLLHSQKMELVGQLAGGIAHDFNNHLTAILGNIEFAIGEVDDSHPVAEYIKYTRQAALRSAELTNQLLAFARKQKAVPKVLDLNMEIEELLPMLSRLIDGRIHIDWRPGNRKAFLSIDPSQLDQILTNLCVNAQDSISGEGKITITTDIVQMKRGEGAEELPGEDPEYLVSLSVSDTGCGIDQQVVPHIFEPFFTTKEIGKGTGLGLSTVYGIVKQNKGSIECNTEQGQGTTFTLFFPQEQIERDTGSVSNTDASTSTDQKTILVVDDEVDVLNLVKGILEKYDFRVIAASDAETAMGIAARYPFQIDLLLTDIRMPIMNGVELSRQMQADYPNLKTLFMSGYAPSSHDKDLVADSRCKFIPKPFTIRDLIESVNTSLGLTSPRTEVRGNLKKM